MFPPWPTTTITESGHGVVGVAPSVIARHFDGKRVTAWLPKVGTRLSFSRSRATRSGTFSAMRCDTMRSAFDVTRGVAFRASFSPFPSSLVPRHLHSQKGCRIISFHFEVTKQPAARTTTVSDRNSLSRVRSESFKITNYPCLCAVARRLPPLLHGPCDIFVLLDAFVRLAASSVSLFNGSNNSFPLHLPRETSFEQLKAR